MTDQWITGDGRVVQPKVPAKPSAQWKAGFRAGVDAMLVVLQDSAGGRCVVHGASVFLLADHHIDQAAVVARQRFGKPAKGVEDTE